MRLAFFLFACLLGGGVLVNLVVSQEQPMTQPRSRRAGWERAERPQEPDDVSSSQESNQEADDKDRWRKLRFWDVYEPTKVVKWDSTELYVERYASRNIIDPKVSLFEVKAERVGERGLLLTGKVIWPELGEGVVSMFRSLGYDPVDSRIRALPDEALGTRVYALSTTHTLRLRREPKNESEQLDQAALGDGVRLLEVNEDGAWARVVVADGYVGWAPTGHMRRVDHEEWDRYFSATEWVRARRPIRLEKSGEVLAVVPVASLLPVADVAGDSAIAAVTGRPDRVPMRRSRRGSPTPTPEPDAALEVTGSETVIVRLPFAAPDDLAVIPAEIVERVRIPGDETSETIRSLTDPLLGVPYVWGGISERGVDCSGFTQYIYRMEGLSLARDADEQSVGGRLVYRRGEILDRIRPGDLLFFINSSGRVSHVAVSLGGTEYAHSAGGMVGYGSLDPSSPNFIESYVKKLAFAKRYRLEGFR